MIPIFGILVAAFFIFSIICGLIAPHRRGSRFFLIAFWVFFLLFLTFSSALLSSFVPTWIAFAPTVPLLIFLAIFLFIKHQGSGSDSNVDR